MDRKIIFEDVRDFSLDMTFDCGQCFRWKKQEDGSYFGVVRRMAVKVHMEDNRLVIDGADESNRRMWEDYFDLLLDYADVKKSLSDIHPTMKEAASYASGIRILRQEPFEALITFIISQNNNIKRIAGIVERLCENFGEEIAERVYAFPTAERLSGLSEEELSPIRAGFRHKYILDAARKISAGEIDLESLRVMPYEEANRELMRIKGVGEKVADCVLLYGLHRLESFPKDVWMKRAMKELFDDMDPAAFGEYAGIAQQYIFHYSRMHPKLFKL